jgi:hypothetical protein
VSGREEEDSVLFDLGQLKVEGVIVHDVPKSYAHAQTPSAPTLSEVESPLNQTIKNFFHERLSVTLGSSAFEAEFTPGSTSPLPSWIGGLLATKPSDFVATSQAMAEHLHQTQDGTNPAGLLTVVRCKIGTKSAVSILKLEKEEGTRVQQQSLGGRKTLSVSHVRNLMLTEKTKVFKVGLFAKVAKKVEGMVCDTQRRQGTAVAYFFLERFLGCRLKDEPEVVTRRFYSTAQDFINDEVEAPETKGRYEIALVAELTSPRTAVSPQAFAANLDVADRAQFMNKMTEVGIVAPSFPKDNHLIGSQLRRIVWTFQGGTSVLAKADSVGQEVTTEDLPDGRLHLEVTDHLKEVGGHR